ncbi:MAG: glucosamine-6-phosphate deaminase [Longicatena sp.]
MKLIITENAEEMSETAAQYLLGQMLLKPNAHIAITGGSTPKRMYEIIVPKVKDKDQFAHITYYNFDEIPYRKENREGVTISGLRNLYFNPANIAEKQIYILDQFSYLQQDSYIEQLGGLDLMVLGLGADGHFCGNMPATTAFGDATKKVDFKLNDKEQIVREFGGVKENVPDYFITMGPRSVMQAKSLLMIAYGKGKAEIIKKLMAGKVEECVPSSILMLHPNITMIIDKDAASLL